MTDVRVGVVVIGRNEGERLRLCLESIVGRGAVVVYVDSGSVDGSVELAIGLGVEVVDLDLSRPFSAARARNEGFDRLLAIAPGVQYVQFVDGDCEVVDGWLDRAARELDERPDAAVVAGRLRERHPERTIYNRLADLEWADAPIGEARSCGGVAMMRVEALKRVGGFNSALIAGEEPELCVRLRRDGWRIFRPGAEMALHDMDMTKFRQWWRRNVRAGHAYAEGWSLHGGSPARHYARQARSIVVLGIIVPLLALGLAWPTRGASLLLSAVYPASALRTYRYARIQRGWSSAHARIYAFFTVLGKFANALGLIRYWLGRITGKRSRVVDFRGGASAKVPSGVGGGVDRDG